MISIIIPCYNAYDYTKQCIESIQRNTHINYELIIVDNGSTDETIKMNMGFTTTILRNETNLGFAKAVNQGINNASGEYICILNNDTVVTHEWLSRMRWHLTDGGLDFVAPCGSSMKGDQDIDIGFYDNVSELEQLTDNNYNKHRHMNIYADCIIGFCILFKRDVYETVGDFDERFGLGNYEEIDYCRMVKNAGFKIGVVKDVFIHHYRQVTFMSLGDSDFYADLLKENKNKYEEKWGCTSAT